MDKKELVKSILDDLLHHFDIKPQTDISVDGDENIKISIQGDDLSFLIGYRGQSLDALQSILTHIYYKKSNEWPVLLLDINDYNSQRIERLHSIARRSIDKVRFFQSEVILPYMNPWERRQVHTLISEYDDVISESQGEGRNRRVHLKPKNKTS
ncbi:KH domain-containing protein [candidate division WWE3 bacterium]|jgi:spoIIIJ-associated protein|uniref:KH domain-containing protein n=1 Tax=candidate division WWE3 bacterium TaxID=2053526 RepID=A0A3A4ZCG7_UNCKA|nr:MAG: KH domain-containing protein [candidate division WWE3 bacterium]